MGLQYTKPALTFEDQLRQLEARGLVIEDREAALDTLRRVSYYRLSGYWFPFRRQDDSFKPGTSFAQAVAAYEFDRQLRLLVMDAIERVEVDLRTAVTYTLARERGPFAHEDPKNFAPRSRFWDWQEWHDKLTKEVGRAKEQFLAHYRQKYDGFPRVPIWMATEVVSFGALSLLYENMLASDKAKVAARWGIRPPVAESWTHALTHVRNVCAHHGRLWSRTFTFTPMLPKGEPVWNSIASRNTYCVLCILRRLTQSNAACDGWARQVVALLQELDNSPDGKTAMGIPDGWSKQAFWSACASSVNAA